jgi:hypothetical protein
MKEFEVLSASATLIGRPTTWPDFHTTLKLAKNLTMTLLVIRFANKVFGSNHELLAIETQLQHRARTRFWLDGWR